MASILIALALLGMLIVVGALTLVIRRLALRVLELERMHAGLVHHEQRLAILERVMFTHGQLRPNDRAGRPLTRRP